MAEDSLELEDMLQRLRVAEDKAPTDEERAARLQRAMGLLAHASACADPRCAVRHCSKIKALFHHAAACPVHLGGGCQYCHRTWALLQSHANMCTATRCTVPRCRCAAGWPQRVGSNCTWRQHPARL